MNGEVILLSHYLMVSTPSPKEDTHYKVIQAVQAIFPPFSEQSKHRPIYLMVVKIMQPERPVVCGVFRVISHSPWFARKTIKIAFI